MKKRWFSKTAPEASAKKSFIARGWQCLPGLAPVPAMIGCILFFWPLGAQGAIPAIERNALIALYNSTDGNNWSNSSGWKGTGNAPDGFSGVGSEGSWFGVTVEGDHVVSISLQWNQLEGPIPTELGSLSRLEALDLYDNLLNGAVPEVLGNLSELVSINLSFNNLEGGIPARIGNLARLESLDFSSNQLSGSLPPELGDLAALEQLDLWGNRIGGQIPPELGSLANLRLLDLSSNALTGSIPKELGDLTSLDGLYLYGNQLTGTIPPELGNMADLKDLVLWGNALSGGIPAEIGRLKKLERLDLGGNQLNGRIPPGIGSLSALQRLYLSDNAFWGCIPPVLSNLQSLNYISVGANKLFGNPPAEMIGLVNLNNGSSDFANNHLQSADNDLKAFLSRKQLGGDWASSQTFYTGIPHVEPGGQCGGYGPCFTSIGEAMASNNSYSMVFVAGGNYKENVTIGNGSTLEVGWNSTFNCNPAGEPVVISGP